MRASLGTMRTMQSSARCSMPEAAGRKCVPTSNARRAAYSPTWIDGKKHARNVYAHTREECEEKLKVLIAEMKAELAELKRQKGYKH